jgi:large subunit ribosomal protein L25
VGLLVQADTIRVRCLPLEIPDFIEVDIRPLEIHQSLHVKDLVLPAGVEMAAEPDELVLSIVEKRELIVAAPAAAEGEAVSAEPELIAKAPKEEAEGEGEAAPAK